jgi:hypothetical protein
MISITDLKSLIVNVELVKPKAEFIKSKVQYLLVIATVTECALYAVNFTDIDGWSFCVII